MNRLLAQISSRSILLGVLVMTSGAAIGCGSDDGDAFEGFTGVWDLEADSAGNSRYTLACPDQPADDVGLWGGMWLERGTVSDLLELSWDCRIAYDVQGASASAQATDPYTMLPPTCEVLVGTFMDPMTMTTFDLSIVLNPQTSWKFSVLGAQKGQLPRGEMNGSAQFIERHRSVTDATAPPTDLPACTYTANAVQYRKVTRD